MIKICKICKSEYKADNYSRIYCYKGKDFKLGSVNTMSWDEYKTDALKCILVCSNCHKEIHNKLGYKF